MRNRLSLYILHVKYIKIISLLRPFSGLVQKICQAINMFHQPHWGFLSPCYVYNQETKILETKDSIWELAHFTSHSEFKLKYSDKQNKYGEHNFNLNFTQCWLNVDNSR